MDYSIVNFIEGAMALLIGLLLVINLAMYIMKLSRNTTMMFIAVLGLMVINIANILTPVRFDLGFEIIKETLLTDIPMTSLMVVLMIIMRSKTIKSETMLYSIRSSFNDIKDAGVPIGETILRSNLKEIIKAETIAEWDRGYQFYLKSAHPNEYRILFDRRGSKVFASLSFLGDQSVFDSYRMIPRGIATDNGDVETCDTVRFYGEDGFFIQLIVVETYEVDEHMSLRSLRRKKQTEEPEAEF